MSPSLRTPILVGLLWSAFLFAIPPSANAGVILQAPTYVGLNSGLVGHWSFDGQNVAGVTAYDRSGQGNNGTLTGGPVRTAGKIGQALSFDGVDDYVNLGTAPILEGLPAVSVALWVQFSNANNAARESIVFSVDGGSMVNMNRDSDALNSIQFAVNGVTAVDNTINMRNTNWHHLVGVYDGARVQIYIDTVAGDSTPPALSGLTSGGGGTNANDINNGGTCACIIDEVRYYNRALSPDEIRRLYKIGSTFVFNATRKDTLTSGLVGHWSFDGQDVAGVTAYDRSGQGNNGTLTNGPARVAGKLGQALEFDGSDDYVTAPETSSLDIIGDRISFGGWILPKISNDYQLIVGKIFGAGRQYSLFLQENNTLGLHITLNGVAGFNPAPLSKRWVVNTWNHVFVVYDGSLVRAYLNGEQVFSSTASGNISNVAGSQIYMGEDNGANEVNGLLDDVRIYNRALSADEIKRLYNMGGTYKINASRKDVLTDGLVGYWSFDGQDVAGVTAYDRSGQGNNGTLTNSPTRAAGKIGQALFFDNTDDFVDIANSADLGEGNALTLSMWTRLETPIRAGHRMLIAKWREAVGMTQWQIRRIGYTGGAEDGKLYFTLYNSSDVGVSAISDGQFFDDTAWHHIAAVYDGTVLQLYGDGAALIASPPSQSGPIKDFTNRICIAGEWNGSACSSGLVEGAVDDVRIYDRALSPDEIKRLYNMGR